MFVYGIGRSRGSGMFWSDLLESSMQGHPCDVPYGDATFTWQYVEDVADLTVLAAESGCFDGRSVNTPGDYRSTHYMVDCLLELCPSAQVRILPGQSEIDWDCRADAVERVLGFTPRFDIRSGLSRCIELAHLRNAESGLQSAFPIREV